MGPKGVKKGGKKSVKKDKVEAEEEDDDLGVVVNGLKAASISARTVLPPNMRDEEDDQPEKEKEREVKVDKKGKKDKKGKEVKGDQDEPWPRPSCDKTITVCKKNARINEDVGTVIVRKRKCSCKKQVCECCIKLCLPAKDKCPENYYQASEKTRKKWVCGDYSSDSSDEDKCGCKRKDCKKCWSQECFQIKKRTHCVKRNKNVDQYDGQRILFKNCSNTCVKIIPHKKNRIRTCDEKLCSYTLECGESLILVNAGKYWFIVDK